ncbi:Uncharacterised protein [Candidatus Anstonella stagnisolia]|nr:Uncharacterised protein [Candidatus Anstonella stagnisolia]
MDITLVGILLASVGMLSVLVYLMCRDAMSESWLAFSTQSRQQMRSEEGKKHGIKEELGAFAGKVFSYAQKKKPEEAQAAQPAKKEGMLSNVYVRIFLASAALYLLFFGYFFLTAKPPSFETSVSEEPLAKVAQLSLAQGEYAYSMDSNGTPVHVHYAVVQVPSCAGYLIIGEDKSQLCIGKNGNAVGGMKSGMSTTQDGAFYLFSPWMLAVKEGWVWGINTTVTEKSLGINYTTRLEYAYVSMEKILGRDAYKISISVQGKPAGIAFIDAEKRVLLLQNSTFGEIALSKAPFLK